MINTIIALGNIDDQYNGTRHNVGQAILTDFLKTFSFPELVYDKYIDSLKAEASVNSIPVRVIFPHTYMNLSGDSVSKVMHVHSLSPENILVIHDELDLALGNLKLSESKGSGGHNGVESIEKALGTREFARLRVGIGQVVDGEIRRFFEGEKSRFVLEKFTDEEQKVLEKVSKRVTDILKLTISEGIVRAMNQWN